MHEEMTPLEKYLEWRKWVKDSRSPSGAATLFQIERNTQSVLREFYRPNYPKYAFGEYARKVLGKWKINALYRRQVWKISYELQLERNL